MQKHVSKTHDSAVLGKFLKPGQSITLTMAQVKQSYALIGSVMIAPKTVISARALAPVLANGGRYVISAEVIREVAMGLGQKPPQAQVAPISTTVVVIVLAAAAMLGFGVGFVMSEAADDSDSGSIKVTNNNGEVEIATEGDGGDTGNTEK